MGNGTEQMIRFDAALFKNLKVWNVSFDNGQKAMLYKLGNEWMQHNESELDSVSLLTIGKQIDYVLTEA
jgi:hypothetical protein